MQLHSNAATCPRQRQLIRNSAQTMRTLAHNLGVSVATVHKWTYREDHFDRSCRPNNIHYALQEEEESLLLWLRQTGELLLDDLFDSMAPLMPHLRRSSLHRLLRRNGCSRLPQKEQQPTGSSMGHLGTFKEYGQRIRPWLFAHRLLLLAQTGRTEVLLLRGHRPRYASALSGGLLKPKRRRSHSLSAALSGVLPV